LNLDVFFLADLGAVIPCAADLDLDFSLRRGRALSEKFRVIGGRMQKAKPVGPQEL